MKRRFLVSQLILGALLSGCNGTSAPVVPVPVLVADTPDQVATVVIEGRGAVARLARDSGDWLAGPGTSQNSALLMADADGLLPLLAYRCFAHQDLTDPDWGLGRPTITYTITDRTGPIEVVIGSPNFNLAGFYAHRSGDPRLCLVPRSTVAALMSAALGRPVRIKTAEDAKIARLLDRDGNPRPQVTVDPWVAQAQHAAMSAGSPS